ncbi:MAG: GumC family protein [Armatimonadota bacterium]
MTDIIQVFRNQRRTIAWVVFVIVLVSVAWTLLVMKQQWTATTTILFESASAPALPAELTALLPSVATGKDYSGPTFESILRSRSVREQVVDKLDLVSAMGVDSREKAVRQLENSVNIIYRMTHASVLSVEAVWASPPRLLASEAEEREAADMSAAIANAYIESLEEFLHKADFTRAVRRTEFLKSQLDEVEQAMLQAQDDLVSYATEHGMIEPSSQAGAAVTALRELRQRESTLRTELEGARETEREALQELNARERMVVTSISESRNPALDALDEEIRTLERELAQETEVEGKSDQHPDVQRLRVRLNTARQQLSDEIQREMRTSAQQKTVSGAYQSLVDEAVTAQLRRASLEAQLGAVREAQVAAINEMQSIPASSARYQELERQLRVKAGVYEQLARQYEASRVEAAAAMPDFTVLDYAVPAERASGPSLRNSLAIALVVSVVLSTIIAFWREGCSANSGEALESATPPGAHTSETAGP